MSACLASPKDPPPEPVTAASSPVLRRLSAAEIKRSVRDLFGPEVTITSPLEPETTLLGLRAIGAGVASISAWGVEQVEAMAFEVAEQALLTPESRARLGVASPSGVVDLELTKRFVADVGKRA